MKNTAMKDLKTAAVRAMEKATKLGASGVRVLASRSRNCSVTYRDARPEKVQEASRVGLSLHLYIEGRYTTCSTCDLRPAALDRFLESSVAMCRAMAVDADRRLPEPELYAGRRDEDLSLFDEQIDAVEPANRHAYAKAVEAATKEAVGERAISIEATYSDSSSAAYQVHSNGFEGERLGTYFGGYVRAALQDDDERRPSGGGRAAARYRVDLPAPEAVAAEAAEDGMSQLGATKIESARMPMILDNRAVGGLLRFLLQASQARQLQQKASFLADSKDKEFGSPLLHITDDPFIKRGFGSRLFDGEGIAARAMPFFEDGILRNYYIGTYYGRKLDMAPTTGESSNLVMRLGDKSLDGLIADVDRGILVRGFLGGNGNSTTGDFSLGIHGTLIENGRPARAVSAMNIAGNHTELWKNLTAVGNDPYPYGSMRIPSLRFDDVQFSGV